MIADWSGKHAEQAFLAALRDQVQSELSDAERLQCAAWISPHGRLARFLLENGWREHEGRTPWAGKVVEWEPSLQDDKIPRDRLIAPEPAHFDALRKLLCGVHPAGILRTSILAHGFQTAWRESPSLFDPRCSRVLLGDDGGPPVACCLADKQGANLTLHAMAADDDAQTDALLLGVIRGARALGAVDSVSGFLLDSEKKTPLSVLESRFLSVRGQRTVCYAHPLNTGTDGREPRATREKKRPVLGPIHGFGIACPQCERLTIVREDAIGDVIRCQGCGAPITVEKPAREKPRAPASLPQPRERSGEQKGVASRLNEEVDPKLVPKGEIDITEYSEGSWDSQPKREGPVTRHPALIASGIVFLFLITGALLFYLAFKGNSDSTDPAALEAKARQALPEPREVAENFLHADSLEQRLEWVRHPEKHEAAIRHHWETVGAKHEAVVEELVTYYHHFIEDDILESFHVKFAGNRHRLLCVLEQAGQRLVDWECYARSCSPPMEDLLAGTAKEGEVRVFVSFADDPYAEPGHRDAGTAFASGYRAFELTSPDWDESIRGFVEISSRTAITLAKAMSESMRRAEDHGPQRMTLLIASKDTSHERKDFLIHRVVAKGWVKAGGPDYQATQILPMDLEGPGHEPIQSEQGKGYIFVR